jgi:hypothetical protein
MATVQPCCCPEGFMKCRFTHPLVHRDAHASLSRHRITPPQVVASSVCMLIQQCRLTCPPAGRSLRAATMSVTGPAYMSVLVSSCAYTMEGIPARKAQHSTAQYRAWRSRTQSRTVGSLFVLECNKSRRHACTRSTTQYVQDHAIAA